MNKSNGSMASKVASRRAQEAIHSGCWTRYALPNTAAAIIAELLPKSFELHWNSKRDGYSYG